MSKSSQSKKASTADIQTQQKLLYYRSELNKLRTTIDRQEKKIKEQSESIHSLITKVYEQPDQIIQPTEETIEDSVLLQCDCYFSYTLVIPKQDDDEPITMIGDFIIRNTGSIPLQEPVICIEYNHPKLANLSGKIKYGPTTLTDQYIVTDEIQQEPWEFVEGTTLKEAKKAGLFSLKPVNRTSIRANETLSFSHFEIQIPPDIDESEVVVQGYMACKEFPEGIPSLNKMICNLV
ncbi:hypothetical protein AB685_28340 [Bacillus sp. LL01]|uniref:hypothetical protein n=1 Tax=Bacillus sp. LL01 TaxID=1665556 RepID=UPI00064CE154|nr:hypothetical protein [Bacillus sp. LL01]KMJ55228.1 hypothetical protein AB685_28340 [Bacillus sp. LL01]